MSRPAFALSDDEARMLLSELAQIEQRCPLSPRDHRQFVREFIRSVHRVTGKAFSPAIYRRLLSAYAPERRPSTATLALEKERFVKELERIPSVPDALDEAEGHSGRLVAQLKQIVDDLVVRPTSRGQDPAASYLRAQCDFLQQRLSQCEKQLAESKSGTAEADAQRRVLAAQLLQAHNQIEVLQANGDSMSEQLSGLTRAINDARQFALLAIDEARGETRAWKERFLAAEAQSKAQASLTETFRRLAYRQGADIPSVLSIKP